MGYTHRTVFSRLGSEEIMKPLLWLVLILIATSLGSCVPATLTGVTDTLTLIDTNPENKEHNAIKFAFALEDWDEGQTQWSAPSSFVIRANGDSFLFAAKLTNDRKSCSIFDCWDSRVVGVSVRYFTEDDGENCTGSVIHSSDYSLSSVAYRARKLDVASRTTDPEFAAFAEQIKCATLTRWVR